MNAALNPALSPAPYFPNEKSSDSDLAYFCVEAANAMQAVTDILGEAGIGEGSFCMSDLAALLRIIQSPIDAASNELHRRLMTDNNAKHRNLMRLEQRKVTDHTISVGGRVWGGPALDQHTKPSVGVLVPYHSSYGELTLVTDDAMIIGIVTPISFPWFASPSVKNGGSGLDIPITRKQVSILSAAKKTLALDDLDFRTILQRYGGADSAAGLKLAGFECVMDRFLKLGLEAAA